MQVQAIGENNFSNKTIDAITKFQSLWRRYRIRRNYLSQNSYDIAKQYIDRCTAMSDIPRASSGITRVYLPSNLPVVFKALGIQRSKNRFFTMWKARDLCKRNGYKHLLIPTAHPYKEYNIEDKLPVHDVKQREQIALYEENLENFSIAVREFTGFLCQCVFPDILTDTHPYQKEHKIPLGRCDNLPLVLDDKRGKIALIDLGGHQVRNEKLSQADALESAKTAIFIFPHHFDDIFDVVTKFCPEIIDKRTHLQEICEQALGNFKHVYKNHRKFVQQKMISEPCQRKEDTLQKMQLAISKACKIYQSLAFNLIDSPLNKETIAQLTKKIIKQLIDQFAKETTPKQPLASYICSRSITINCHTLSEIFQNKEGSFKAQSFLQIILEELINSKEVCYAQQYHNHSQKLLIRIHY